MFLSASPTFRRPFAEGLFDVTRVVLSFAFLAELLVVVHIARSFLDLALRPGQLCPGLRPCSTFSPPVRTTAKLVQKLVPAVLTSSMTEMLGSGL